MPRLKITNKLMSALTFTVFSTFIITGAWLLGHNRISNGIDILFAAAIFIILRKLDNLDRAIRKGGLE